MAAPDSTKLAERLNGSSKKEYWLHVESKSPLEKYPAKHHARRVRDKLDVAEGLLYLPGAPTRNNEDSDMPAPFRQRKYFYYLTGCDEANCHVTYDIQHDILALFIPRIDPVRVIYNGRGSTPAEAMDKYDIDEVYYVDELQRELLEWQSQYTGDLYVLHENQAPKSPARYCHLDTTSLQPAMNFTRMIKDEHEIKLIRKANDISSEAHKKVLANITKFKNEAQVEGLFVDVCISRQAKHQAYDPIVASGPNAGTLHYAANNEDFGDRQLLCIDAGCEFENYASDITRTFPLSGSWPSLESENIYKLVQRMQETCIERLAPGVRYLDLHILAHQIAIDGLLSLGILHNGTREEIYKTGTSRAFFPHGLGHHVGLEVHDVGQKELMSFNEKTSYFEKAPSLYPEDFHLPVYDNDMCRAPTNPESPHLEEGMVVTVEPGIYFSAYALAQFYLPSPIHSKYINTKVLKKYLAVGGVRIEDDILITTKGYENLTTAPKGEAMMNIIRNQTAECLFGMKGVKAEPLLEEMPLLRAPGISKRMSESKIKPVSRASTAPVTSPGGKDAVDFEPFQGPSLYSGFKPPSATSPSLYSGFRESCATGPSLYSGFEQSSETGPSLYSGFEQSSVTTITKLPEMRQLRETYGNPTVPIPIPNARTVEEMPNELSAGLPPPQKDMYTRATANAMNVPAEMPQRRSATLDSYSRQPLTWTRVPQPNTWSLSPVPSLHHTQSVTSPSSHYYTQPHPSTNNTNQRLVHHHESANSQGHHPSTRNSRERQAQSHPLPRPSFSRPSLPTLRSGNPYHDLPPANLPPRYHIRSSAGSQAPSDQVMGTRNPEIQDLNHQLRLHYQRLSGNAPALGNYEFGTWGQAQNHRDQERKVRDQELRLKELSEQVEKLTLAMKRGSPQS